MDDIRRVAAVLAGENRLHLGSIRVVVRDYVDCDLGFRVQLHVLFSQLLFASGVVAVTMISSFLLVSHVTSDAAAGASPAATLLSSAGVSVAGSCVVGVSAGVSVVLLQPANMAITMTSASSNASKLFFFTICTSCVFQ